MARLLCVGDLNADITITAEAGIVAGSDTPGVVRLDSGGAAANVAAAAAEAGLDTRFRGVVGDDLLGRFLADELRGHGVEVEPVVRSGASSRAVAALIASSGDRSMVSDLASATVLRIDDIDSAWFDDIDWLHLTAYTWFPAGGDQVFARLVDLATQRGIGWSVDPSSAHMLESSRPQRDPLVAFRGAEVLFPNLDEAVALTGIDDPSEAAMQLLDVAATVVVTRGADGVVVAARDRPAFHAPAHQTGIVNTLGAGDAFAGGFIRARLGGHDDQAATQAGLAAAARAVGRSTAR